MSTRPRHIIALGLVAIAIIGLIAYLNHRYPGTLSDRYNQIDFVRLTVLLVLAASLVVTFRSARFGAAAGSLLAWIGVGFVLVIAYSYWEEIAPVINRVGGNLFPAEPRVIAPGAVALSASSGRHFRVVAEANGQRVRFMIDTGASDVTLTRDDARRIGIDPERLTYDLPYRTANGISFGAPVRIDKIRIGEIMVDDVAGHVAGGNLDQSLLGMSFLRRLSGFEFRDDELILRQ